MLRLEDHCERLNQLLKKDPRAFSQLFALQVACNWKLEHDPTLVVGGSKTCPTISVLGLLNGLLTEREAFTATPRSRRLARDINDQTGETIRFTIVEVPE
jgi:hypothetical protein